MIRVIKRNTNEESCKYDLELVKNDLSKSGYKEEHVESIKSKAFERVNAPKIKAQMNNTIIFTVDYFDDYSELKEIVKKIEQDIKAVFGISVLVATRKCNSIGNLMVKTKHYM